MAKTAKAKRKTSGGTLAENRRARHHYTLEDVFEAGLVLRGWEVKAIRAGRAQLAESHVVVRRGELYLLNCHVSPLSSSSTHVEAASDADAETAAAWGADSAVDREGAGGGADFDSAELASVAGEGEVADGAGAREKAPRQAGKHQAARVGEGEGEDFAGKGAVGVESARLAEIWRENKLVLYCPPSLAMTQTSRKKTDHEFRDPIHGFIHMSSDELQVVNSPPFQRLRQHSAAVIVPSRLSGRHAHPF